MKTSKVKVRFKDLKQGVTVYTACPWYSGVEKKVISSRPIKAKNTTGYYFVRYIKVCEVTGNLVEQLFFLGDYGIPDAHNNYKRPFFKRKHAEAWCAQVKEDPAAIRRQEAHKERVRTFNYLPERLPYSWENTNNGSFLRSLCNMEGR